MRRTPGTPLVFLLVLAACGGGGTPADTGPPRDPAIDRANAAGTQALSMEMPALAIRQYKVALDRAYERDDASAIADVAFNLALAQLKAGDARGAIATIQTARRELERRRVPEPAELGLVQAAASYRVGDPAGAGAAARQAIARPAGDPDTVARAWFIMGLVAADQENRAGLAEARAALPPSKSADLEADRLELQARAQLLDEQPAEALSTFDRAVAVRQTALDYRGMVRALSFAGEASLRLDRRDAAATYFLRAGRSALLQGDDATALPLLRRASDLARQSGQADVADEVARLLRDKAKVAKALN